jgi:methionyl-tRNA formyltransferase
VKLVFMGYGLLGANVLNALAAHHRIALVVTHERGFSGLGEPHVELAAERLGIPVEVCSRADSPALHERMQRLSPDAITSTNWRTTVPGAVLRIPRLGAVNVHDALLPGYGGFGAVNWAIRNGESCTGLTAHLMDEELDTGPVITRAVVPIATHDDARCVLDRLLAQYAPVTLEALRLLEAGQRGEPQTGEASFYHRIGIEDTRIDWTCGTTQLYDLVRGQSDPFLNAWTECDGRRLFIKAAAIPKRAYRGTPGRIVKAADGGVAIACGGTRHPDGHGLIVQQVQTEDGPSVRAVDYFLRFGGYLF